MYKDYHTHSILQLTSVAHRPISITKLTPKAEVHGVIDLMMFDKDNEVCKELYKAENTDLQVFLTQYLTPNWQAL